MDYEIEGENLKFFQEYFGGLWILASSMLTPILCKLGTKFIILLRISGINFKFSPSIVVKDLNKDKCSIIPYQQKIKYKK